LNFKLNFTHLHFYTYIYTHISKDDGNQEKDEKDDEEDIRCNNSNMTSDATGIVTANQDNSIKV